jgi:putative NADH-flavin reductase
MKVLITGAFGNIGKAVIEDSFERGHEILVFEIDSKKTRGAARELREKKIENAMTKHPRLK